MSHKTCITQHYIATLIFRYSWSTAGITIQYSITVSIYCLFDMYCRSLTLAHPNMGCAVPMKIFLKIEMLYRNLNTLLKQSRADCALSTLKLWLHHWCTLDVHHIPMLYLNTNWFVFSCSPGFIGMRYVYMPYVY